MLAGMVITFFTIVGLNLMLDLKNWKERSGAIILGVIVGIIVGLIVEPSLLQN